MKSTRIQELRELATNKGLTRAVAQAAIVELCDELDVCRKSREKQIGPSLADVMAYAEEIGMNSGEPEKFYDYHQARGWKMGRAATAPMRDWRAAMRLWKRNCIPANGKTENIGSRYGVG